MSNTFEYNYSYETGCSPSSAAFWNPEDDFHFYGYSGQFDFVGLMPVDRFSPCSGRTTPYSLDCPFRPSLLRRLTDEDILSVATNILVKKSGPVVDEDSLTSEEFRKLRQLGIIVENSELKYVLNPVLNLFKFLPPKKLLETSLAPEDDFLYAYMNVANSFRLDSKNELVFEGDDRLRILQDHFAKIDNLKHAHKAQKLVEAMWGKELYITDITNIEKNGRNADLIILRAETTSAKCPYCGKVSKAKSKESGSHTREVEDLPIRIGRPLYIRVKNVRKYRCQNEECEHYGHLFDEQCGFLMPYLPRTNRLNALILASAIDGSFHGTERMLKMLGIEVGDDCIRNIIMNIKFPDDINIKGIGVDDVAFRKGQSYLTAIYALSGHHMLTLLEGRDGTELEKWLEKHPKVNLICRDRSSAYTKHIDEWAKKHNVEVIQVADRFHLVKNCIDHLTENKNHSLPSFVAFNKKTGKILDSVPDKTAKPATDVSKITYLNDMEYDNSPPVDESGQEILFSVSLQEPQSQTEMGAEENGNGQTSNTNTGNTCQEHKYKMACAIRRRFDPNEKKNLQYEKLAEEFGIKPSAVARYVRMSKEEVEELLVTKPRKENIKEIDSYKYIIFKMMKDGICLVDILVYVGNKGYKKGYMNLAKYILEIFKIVFPGEPVPSLNTMVQITYSEDIIVYTRNQIVKHLLTVNPKTKKDQFLDGKEDEITKKYPGAQNIRKAFDEFYKVIMGHDEKALEELCKRTDHIKELEGFYKYIEADLEPVTNAIKYTWSSGFVEGNNNRFKLLKRIGYGRMKLETLRQKCMLAFSSTQEGFELGGLVQWITLLNEIDPNTEFGRTMAC